MASCLNSALRALSRRQPNTWPSDRDRQVKDGALFCVTTRQTLLPWICSLSRPLTSTCSMLSSSSGWIGGSSSRSTLPQIRRLTNLASSLFRERAGWLALALRRLVGRHILGPVFVCLRFLIFLIAFLILRHGDPPN